MPDVGSNKALGSKPTCYSCRFLKSVHTASVGDIKKLQAPSTKVDGVLCCLFLTYSGGRASSLQIGVPIEENLSSYSVTTPPIGLYFI